MNRSKGKSHGAEDAAEATAGEERSAAEAPASVTWDDSAMQLSYANVINVLNTREEFSLFFGQNQTWDIGAGHGLLVKLGNRVVMSPYAVKRLHILLGERLAAYEARFGALNVSG